MAADGTYHGHQQFPTAEAQLIPRVVAVDATEKLLAVEASSLSRWAARLLDPYVDEVFVCNLCRLLRLGALHQVYQAASDDRAIFKAAAQRCLAGVLFEHLDLRKQQVALKQKIKATFRRWGVFAG